MEIWKDVPGYVGLYQVSNITGINKRGIALAANKKRKTAGGYIWKIK